MRFGFFCSVVAVLSLVCLGLLACTEASPGAQPDPQDRLRVLNSAVNIVSTLDARYAGRLAKEGVEIESRLVAAGFTPIVSIMASGRPDCATIKEFVETLDSVFRYADIRRAFADERVKPLFDSVGAFCSSTIEVG